MSSPSSLSQNQNKCRAIVPYTGSSNADETSGAGSQTNECLTMVTYVGEASQPIGVGIPIIPPVAKEKKSRKRVITPVMINDMNNGRLRAELNRRPAWLPVNWTMWKVVRTTGKSAGHVDVYYYAPDQTKFRSKKGVFDYISTDEETLCELPDELDNWHGPTAGVYMMEVTGASPEKMPLAAPRTVKRVSIKDILSGRI